MIPRTADAVVIGGGVNGASIAMHLARLGSGKVLLVDKGHLAGGPTGRSGAMVRDHYLHPVLVRMSMESSEVFRNFADAVGGDARFRQTGRLVLLPERDADAARLNVEMNRELGVDIDAISPADASRIVPHISTDGIALGVYEPSAGHADPVATTYAFAEQATRHGAEIVTGCAVTGIRVSGGRAVGVDTDLGPIDTNTVVAVTGPWANRLAAPLGESLPISAVRVQMVHMRRPPSLESLHTIVIDNTSGTYLRVNHGPMSLLGGEAPDDLGEVIDADACALNADHDRIADLWARMTRRIPDLAAATPLGGYGAMYDMTPDGNPILDRSQTVEGLYWAVGFSGHGFKLSPVVGRMMAELVLHGSSAGHPIEAFRASRFRDADHLEPAHPYTASGHP